MKELGEYSAQFHFQVGERVKQLGLDGLFVLVDDPASEAILVGAGKGEGLKTHGELMAKLKAEIRPGDRLLFKASHSVGLDRVVAALAQTLTI
jgi:UDP-N-acetylmuramoyl-tripeptide--D-alanyl-D-alanine ligase